MLLKIRHSLTVAAILLAAILVSACFDEKEKTYKDLLGDISYDSSVYALVVEKIEDEEEPGVVERAVTDLPELLKTSDIPVCLYFYASTTTDRAGITAGTEDIAQQLDGRVLMVGIDIVSNRELTKTYEVEYIPDFVLLKGGKIASKFDAHDRDYWTATHVYNWLIQSGV